MTTNTEIDHSNLNKYQAFLVRIWQDGDQAAWRASAQCVQSGKIVRFANLDRLFTFLAAQTDDPLYIDEPQHIDVQPARMFTNKPSARNNTTTKAHEG
ncbi:MAG: hypothetical protein KDE53_19290 [Caldilineaceae bacterium]|nr:hypothetical protein [Caldilineaceae bacterium]